LLAAVLLWARYEEADLFANLIITPLWYLGFSFLFGMTVLAEVTYYVGCKSRGRANDLVVGYDLSG
jgi:hypothetical protein